MIDMRLCNQRLRQVIEQLDYSDIPGDSLQYEIKRRMTNHIDAIDSAQKKMDELEQYIREQRAEIKKIAHEWEL